MNKRKEVNIIKEILTNLNSIKNLKREIKIYNLLNDTNYSFESLNIDLNGKKLYINCSLIDDFDNINYKYIKRAYNKYKRAFRWLELKTKYKSRFSKIVEEDNMLIIYYKEEKIAFKTEKGFYHIDANITESFISKFFYSTEEATILIKKFLKQKVFK